MEINWKAKLSSRKFWAMLANTIVQFGMLFGMSSSTAERITNIIMVGGGFIAYMIAEAITDVGDVDASTYVTIEQDTLDTLNGIDAEEESEGEELG